MIEITDEEKKRRKRDLTGKIIGGFIVAGGLFLVFGEQLYNSLILPSKYKAQMIACLQDDVRLKTADATTPESKICYCANTKPSGLYSGDERITAWNSAKIMFTKKAKNDMGISDKVLICEARDLINTLGNTK